MATFQNPAISSFSIQIRQFIKREILHRPVKLEKQSKLTRKLVIINIDNLSLIFKKKLTPEQKKKYDDGFQNNAFNQYGIIMDKWISISVIYLF